MTFFQNIQPGLHLSVEAPPRKREEKQNGETPPSSLIPFLPKKLVFRESTSTRNTPSGMRHLREQPSVRANVHKEENINFKENFIPPEFKNLMQNPG